MSTITAPDSRDSFRSAESGSGTSLEQLRTRREVIVHNFRGYIKKTFDELGAASSEETRNLEDGLKHISLEEDDIRGWESFWDKAKDMMESAHKLYHEELMNRLMDAYSGEPRAVSMKNIGEWSKRFKKSSVHYKDKEAFIRGTLPSYIANWKSVAKRRQKIMEKPAFKKLSSEDVPRLGIFKKEEDFLDLSYSEREDLVADVETAMDSRERSPTIQRLFGEARNILEDAASKHVIGRHTIGILLRRMIKDEDDPQKIAAFVRGGASFTIHDYLGKCAGLRERFNSIEDKRKEKTPTSFHFVHIDVFLNWDYDRRRSYIAEAEHRLQNIEGIQPTARNTLLAIRHELDIGNWNEAGELIHRAKKMDLDTEDRAKVYSMESYLREHGVLDTQELTDSSHPQELVDEINELLGGDFPPSLRRLYLAALAQGYDAFWVLCVLMYNRVWCHRHHYLDTGRELELQKEAKELTPIRIKDGHQEQGLEVNDLTGHNSQDPAIRNQVNIRQPQILITGKDTDPDVIAKYCKNSKASYNDWYWTSIIDKDVDFEKHQDIVMQTNYKMKSASKKLEHMGARMSIGSSGLRLVSNN